MIDVACPYCNAVHLVPVTFSDTRLLCPTCKEPFRLEYEEGEEGPEFWAVKDIYEPPAK